MGASLVEGLREGPSIGASQDGMPHPHNIE